MVESLNRAAEPGFSLTGSADSANPVFTEQIRLLYRHTPSVLVLNFLIAVALVYVLAPVVPAVKLGAWSSLVIGVTLIRVAVWATYRKQPGRLSCRHYAGLFLITCLLQALVWASASILFYHPEHLEYQLLILFILAGLGAGSVASLCPYLPAFFMYFLPSMLPIAVRIALEDGRVSTVLGLLIVIFMVGMCFFARQINASFLLSMKMRFENAALVGRLREQKEEADRANEAKSKFLAAASHDLRQPLHALTLFTALLTNNLESPQNRKLASQINRSLDALQSLFNALLDISRLEAGTLVPEVVNLKVRPLLERIVNDFSGDASAKNVRLTIHTEDLAVRTDPSLIEQVLRNYVSNAVRYTQSGSIQLSTMLIGEEVLLRVKDTGVGIAEDQLDEIYDEFHQLRNPERDRSKGLGLGLAIVKRISQLLNHPIEVQSAVGEGSCFSIRVPVGCVERTADKSASTADVAAPIGGMATNVVVIDDDIDVRESTEALLESWNCRAYVASTPQAILERLQRDGTIPHAIIADYRLKEGRTGIGAIDLIKAHYGDDIPAIIITGDTASEPLQAILNSGIPLLNKPVSPAKLRTFINQAQQRLSWQLPASRAQAEPS